MTISRRDLLKGMISAAALAPMLVPRVGLSATVDASPVPTVLWLRRGRDEYRLDYTTREGYEAAAWLLRDVRANVVGRPSQDLLRLWAWMQAWLAGYGRHQPFNIHSGLRTPKTNSVAEGALGSYHLADSFGVFRAGDMDVPGIGSEYIGRLAYLAGQGGVGFYVRDFTHTDVRGKLTFWRSR